MKRIILAIFFVCITLSLSAATLELFQLDHPVYDEIETLYVLEGKASPLGAKPWSGVDVEHLLSQVEPTSDYTEKLKDKIKSYIVTKDTGFIFNAEFNPQLMVHTNKDAFNSGDYIVKSKLLDEQALTIGLGTYYKNNLALYLDFSLGTVPYDASSETSVDRYKNLFGSNIPTNKDDISFMNMPYNVYFTTGFNAIRFVIGRGKLEWGNGVMGNMMLGNTLPYHDYISLTYTGSKHFSYQFLTSFFTHSENATGGSADRNPQKGLRFFLGHRFEFSFFNNKLLLAVNDGIMYQSKDWYLDPRLLNPMFFMHNAYIAGNSNSLLTVEAEYAPIKNLAIYLQFAIDDLAVMGEAKPGISGASANGVGAMFGLRFDKAINEKGALYGNAEFVYTSPYIYHRALTLDGIDSQELYYVSSIRYMSHGVQHIKRYLSFPFGSDALVGQLQLGYKDLNSFDVKGVTSLMAHGIMRKDSAIRLYNDGEEVVHTPSTYNPFDGKTGSVEYTLTFGVEGEYKVLPYLPINAGIYLITIWNKDNISSSACFDMQFNLGFKLTY